MVPHDRERNREIPIVGRPRGAAWRALQADGVVWEGQVLILGEELDLAARLIVTEQRLAFARGGAVVLEVLRAWLEPSPERYDADGVRLWVTPDEPESEATSLDLWLWENPRGAAQLVRLLQPPVETAPIDATPPATPAPRPRPVEPAPAPIVWSGSAEVPRPALWGELGQPAASHPMGELRQAPEFARAEPPRQPDGEPGRHDLIRVPSPSGTSRDHDWNLKPVKGLLPRTTRRRRGWILRLGGLVLLLVLAALIDSASFPNDLNNRESGNRMPAATGELRVTSVAQAGLPGGAGPVATERAGVQPRATMTPTPVLAAMQTALAFGVGGTIPSATNQPTEASDPALGSEPTTLPDPTSLPESTLGPAPTTAPDPTPIPEPTALPEPTTVPEPTVNAQTIPEATETPEPTSAPDPTQIPEPTAAPELTATLAPTAVPEPTALPDPTATTAPEPTATTVPTPTATTAPEPTATVAPTARPEPTATAAPEPTAAPQPTATEVPAPTATPAPEPTSVAQTIPDPTITPEPTETPMPSTAPAPTIAPEPTTMPDPTPVPEPTATIAPEPTATAVPKPTATLAPTSMPAPTTIPAPTATSEPTATAAPEPTATREPTTAPEPTATFEPTEAPVPATAPEPTIAPQPTATSVPTPTSTPEPTATVAPTVTPEPTATEQPVPTTAPEPTSPPQPTAIPEPTATTAPTVAPEPTATAAPDPTATTVPAPTATVAPAATSEPVATVAPTVAPEPTATVVPEPTATTAPEPTTTPEPTATAGPTEPVPTQQPSLAVNEIPDQVAVDGALRYTVEVARRGASLPDFGLPESPNEWVALVVNVENWTEQSTTFTMDQFNLLAGPDGSAISLDTGTSFIAEVVGLDPAYGVGDSVTVAAGTSARVALVFLLPAGVTDVTLAMGGATVVLDEAIAESSGVGDLGEATAAANLVEAQVREVIDGQSIVVEIDGVPAMVRYLGIEAPLGDDCFAAEATAANANLVAPGATVWLERQRTDTDIRGHLLRDVWAANADGQLRHVGAQLVALGAADAVLDQPNTRYAGWLTALQTTARANGAGKWNSCLSFVGFADQAPSLQAAIAWPATMRVRGEPDRLVASRRAGIGLRTDPL